MVVDVVVVVVVVVVNALSMSCCSRESPSHPTLNLLCLCDYGQAIYTVEVGGAKKLYRHFLKKPDGCLMEVFGDVSTQLQKEQTALERLLINQGQGGYVGNEPL